jgi:hypothetical protein
MLFVEFFEALSSHEKVIQRLAVSRAVSLVGPTVGVTALVLLFL